MSAPRPGLAKDTGPRATRLPALDGLRGIAILLVLAIHFYARVDTPPGSLVHFVLRSSCNLGSAGVDLFFVLSGFLIGGILIDHRDSPVLLRAFYTRRALRILPLYALLLASFYLARMVPGLNAVIGGGYFHSPIADWNYFTFTQNIAESAQRNVGAYWLVPTWSLAVEEQFYLLIPFFVRRLSRPQLVQLCLAGIALSPALRIAALMFAQNGLAAVSLLPMRMDGLLCGVLCAVISRDADAVAAVRPMRGVLTTFLVSCLPIFALLSAGSFETYSWQIAPFGYSLLALFFSATLLRVVLFPDSRLARSLSWRPLQAAGIISYFTYLFHMPVWYCLHWLMRNRPPDHFDWIGGGVTLLSLVLTVMLGAVSWRFFESPLLRFGRRFSYE